MKANAIDELYTLFLNELDLFKQYSEATKKVNHSIRDGGELTEVALRRFLREVVGERFHITHGYIYSSLHKGVSPQIDIIITDKLVPHSLKKFEHLDGMEVVPVEAVAGIFEVKRTLTKKYFTEAINHLQAIVDYVPLRKDLDSRYLPGGIGIKSKDNRAGGNFSNPIIGIISLLNIDPKKVDKIDIPWFMDIVFSCQGYLKAPVSNNNKYKLHVYSYKKQTDSHSYVIYDPKRTGHSREKILQMFVSYLLRYLSEVSGRTFEMNDYFS